MSSSSNMSESNICSSRDRPTHTDYANHLFETGLFSDCTIYSHHRTWHLHRAVLAQRCSFFRACFVNSFRESCRGSQGDAVEVNMHEDDSEAVDRMLKWLYTLGYPSLDRLQEEVEGGECCVDVNANCGPARELATVSSKGNKQARNCGTLPSTFWTSELSLFIVSEKYGLADLASQASDSICRTAASCPWTSPKIPTDSQSPQDFPGSFDDFTEMLEIMYTDLSSGSPAVRELQENLISVSAMAIAARATSHSHLSTLVTTVPEFARDLVEALRRTAEAHATGKLGDGADQRFRAGSGSRRPSSFSGTGLGYRSGSESDASGSESRGSPARADSASSARPCKVYIPMNEDSDVE